MREIIEACQHLLDIGPYDREVGICENIDDYLFFNGIGMFSPKLGDMFKTWEHFSGSETFPVPSSSHDKDPQGFFQTCDDLWQGEQLEYRISLLNHIINELSK